MDDQYPEFQRAVELLDEARIIANVLKIKL